MHEDDSQPQAPGGLQKGELVWLGIMFPSCIFTCVALGYGANHLFDITWGLYAGFALGIAAAYYNLWRTLKAVYYQEEPLDTIKVEENDQNDNLD